MSKVDGLVGAETFAAVDLWRDNQGEKHAPTIFDQREADGGRECSPASAGAKWCAGLVPAYLVAPHQRTTDRTRSGTDAARLLLAARAGLQSQYAEAGAEGAEANARPSLYRSGAGVAFAEGDFALARYDLG